MMVMQKRIGLYAAAVVFVISALLLPQPVAAAAPTAAQMKQTLAAKCVAGAKNKNINFKNLCDGAGRYSTNPQEPKQLAKRLLDMCNGYQKLLTEFKKFTTGGTINGGNCNKIKTNKDLKNLSKDATVIQNPSSGNEPKKPGALSPESCSRQISFRYLRGINT